MSLQPMTYLTEQDYLAWERQQETRHEFFDGKIFAMTGASRAHNLLCGNTFSALHAQLRGTPCLDANQNGPICAKKYRPPSCAVDDCRGKWVTGAGGRRSRSGSHRNRTAIGAGREGSAWSCVVGRRRGGAQGRPGQAQGDAVML